MKTFTIGKKKIVLKEEWMVGFITTWIVGLLAHAYRFFNFLPIWDSIYNFTGVGSTYTHRTLVLRVCRTDYFDV